MLHLAVAALLLGQSPSKQIAEARTMLKDGVRYANHTKRKSSYMSVGDKQKWVRMKTGKEYTDSDGMWRDDVNEIADVYSRHGHIYVVSFTRSSPSGDWNTFATCVYRPDGSLAICDQMYKAFSPAEGAVETQSIFDPQGKLLKETKKAMDLNEKKTYTGSKAQDLFASAKPSAFEMKDLMKATTMPWAK